MATHLPILPRWDAEPSWCFQQEFCSLSVACGKGMSDIPAPCTCTKAAHCVGVCRRTGSVVYPVRVCFGWVGLRPRLGVGFMGANSSPCWMLALQLCASCALNCFARLARGAFTSHEYL